MTTARRVIAIILLTALAAAPLDAMQAATAPVDIVRASVERIPVGSRVRVILHDGKRIRGVLMLVEQDTVVVRERKRLPEPPLRIAIGQVADVELDQNGGGVAKAVAIGAAVGAGAALAVIGFLAAMLGD